VTSQVDPRSQMKINDKCKSRINHNN